MFSGRHRVCSGQSCARSTRLVLQDHYCRRAVPLLPFSRISIEPPANDAILRPLAPPQPFALPRVRSKGSRGTPRAFTAAEISLLSARSSLGKGVLVSLRGRTSKQRFITSFLRAVNHSPSVGNCAMQRMKFPPVGRDLLSSFLARL